MNAQEIETKLTDELNLKTTGFVTYEIISETEHGELAHFVLRNGATVSGPHATPETAWNSAEAKAKSEATKTNRQAVYTAAQSGAAKAVWLVK